jgi:hypothetical protein
VPSTCLKQLVYRSHLELHLLGQTAWCCSRSEWMRLVCNSKTPIIGERKRSVGLAQAQMLHWLPRPPCWTPQAPLLPVTSSIQPQLVPQRSWGWTYLEGMSQPNDLVQSHLYKTRWEVGPDIDPLPTCFQIAQWISVQKDCTQSFETQVQTKSCPEFLTTRLPLRHQDHLKLIFRCLP